MKRRSTSRCVALVAAATLASLWTGCGGGGSDAPAGPPGAFRYAEHRIETAVGVPMTPLLPASANGSPLVAGLVWTVEPSLPPGLALDPSSGVISGTPQSVAAAARYVVRAGENADTIELRVSLPSRFLYSASFLDGTILVQSLDAADGSARSYDLVARPVDLPPLHDFAGTPDGSLLVAAHGASGETGTLVVYGVDPVTGIVDELGRADLGLGPHRIAVRNAAVYVTDQGDDRVSAFTFDAQGAPVPVGSPQVTGSEPTEITLVHDTLVVANRGDATLSSFAVDPVTHALSAEASRFVLNGGIPSAVAESPDTGSLGGWVVVTLENFAIAVTVRVVPETHELVSVFGGVQVGLQPAEVAAHPAGQLFLVASHVEGTVSVLERQSIPNAPPLVRTAILPVTAGPSSISFDAAGRFAYVAASATGEVTVLRIHPHDTPRVEVAGRTRIRSGAAALATLEGPSPVDHVARNAYVIDRDDEAVTVLTTGTTAAVLSPVSAPVLLSGEPTGAALDPLGRFLFVSLGSSSQVASFSIDPSDGALGLAVESPTATQPVDIAVSPGGRVLVVASASPPLLTTYNVDTANGSLTALDIRALPAAPGHVAIDPTGTFVAATSVASGVIVTSAITADGSFEGALRSTTSGGVARTLQFTPDGRFLVTALENRNRIAVFAVGPLGDLSAVPPLVPGGHDTGLAPTSVAVHPKGRHLMTTASLEATTGTLDVSALVPATGAVSFVSRLAVGLEPVHVAFEPRGAFAYVVNRDGRDLSIVRFDAATGIATPLGALTLGSYPLRVLVREQVQ